MLALLFVIGQLFCSALIVTVLQLSGDSADRAADKLSGDPATPSFLALVNLGWALAIPATVLVARALHAMPAGWVASVAGRIRWRWLFTCLGLAFVALAITVMVASLLPDQGTVEMDGSVNPWTETLRDFVLVVVLLTPLQAAGEEYVFRGYLTQALGGLAGRLGRRVGLAVAVVVPALLFALAHGLGQDFPIFFDRFAFGLVAGLLVVLTGGLEASIAMHVLNNLLSFGLALTFSDMTEALTPTGGTWWSIPVTLTQSLVYLGLAVWFARQWGVATRTGAHILEPGQGRV